jgi:ATP-dependent DNA helicase RecG
VPSIRWDSKLASVAGKAAPKIEKAFGYTTVGDLLRHYPRRYVPKGDLSDLGALVVDEHVTVIARCCPSTSGPTPTAGPGGPPSGSR